MDESVFIIPFVIAFFYWIAGLRSNWKKTIILVIISYAAVILAFQNFNFTARLVSSISGHKVIDNEMIVLGFGVALLLALVGLYVLYGVLWNPKASSNQEKPRGEVRLLLSIITASCGWVLGMLFITCIIKYSYPIATIPPRGGSEFLWDVLRATINITNHLVSPWLVEGAPRFLLEIL
jgi:hypothetical protein